MNAQSRSAAPSQRRRLPWFDANASAPEPALQRTSPRSVRLSVTDRCDLACIYCRPGRRDGYFERRLDLDAWTAIAEGLIAAGIRRVRLTGGEPLLYRDIVRLIGRLARLPFEDVALTTNATGLAKLAEPLRDAGLHRLNVSLDSLRDDRFRAMTRGGRISEVIAGIDAAARSGLAPIKLNTVVVRGMNDDEAEDIVQWAWDRGLVPRLIELMPIGEGARLSTLVVPYWETRARIRHLVEDGEPAREEDRGPARYLRSRGRPGSRVGFITGSSETFCLACDRLRVTSDGTLRPCLATVDGVSAESAARGRDVNPIVEAIEQAWNLKPDGTSWKGCTESVAASVSMRQTGG